MEYIIENKYQAKALFEISVNYDGLNYLVIYGQHINGGFCAIPNWNISCEMSTPSDTFFNREQLQRLIGRDAACAIACAIRETAEGTK